MKSWERKHSVSMAKGKAGRRTYSHMCSHRHSTNGVEYTRELIILRERSRTRGDDSRVLEVAHGLDNQLPGDLIDIRVETYVGGQHRLQRKIDDELDDLRAGDEGAFNERLHG